MKKINILLIITLFAFLNPNLSFGQDWIWWGGDVDSTDIFPVSNSGNLNTPGTMGIPFNFLGPMAIWEDSNSIWIMGNQRYILPVGSSFGDMWKFNKTNLEWSMEKPRPDSSIILNAYSGLAQGSPYQFDPTFLPVVSSIDNPFTWVNGDSLFIHTFSQTWVYNTSINQWAWIKGIFGNTIPVTGSLGIPDPVNTPASRSRFGLARQDNFYYFFGGVLPNGSIGCSQDLWRLNLITLDWTYLGGPIGTNSNGGSNLSAARYGIQGLASPQNQIPAKRDHSITADDQGNLWIFSGISSPNNAITQNEEIRNDLWRYEISTSIWTWMNGDSIGNSTFATGPIGVFQPNVHPAGQGDGTRNGVLSYSNGRLYLINHSGYWAYDINLNHWAFLGNNTTAASELQGEAFSGNNPGISSEIEYPAFRRSNGNIIIYGNNGSDELWEWDLNCGPISLQESSQNITCENDNNGQLSISSIGGLGPISYSLNNGPFQTQTNYQNLGPGDYHFRFQDSIGCIRYSDTVTLINPSPITSSISQTSPVRCNNEFNGAIASSASGGWGGFQYSLDSGQTFQSSTSFTGLPAGDYQIIVRDNEGCQDTTTDINLNNPLPLLLSSQSINPITCFFANDASISASALGGVSPYEFGVGGTFQTGNIFNNLSPGAYSIRVRDANNCVVLDTINYSFSDPVNLVPEICLVTVDSTSSFNQVVWENPKDSVMGEVRIYREFLGVYNLAGLVDANDESIFIDQTPGIDPNQQSYRYTIETFDTCGSGANQSPFHETIHVQVSKDVNNNIIIDWDDYEGFTFTQYDIMRSVNGSPYQLLTSVSATVQSQFTDNNPPVGNVRYRVEVVPTAPCETDDNKSTGLFTRTVSNVQGNIVALNKEEWLSKHIQTFPNPAGDELNIRIAEGIDIKTIRLIDGLGNIVIHEEISGPIREHTLNLSKLSQGWYLLEVRTNSVKLITKIVR